MYSIFLAGILSCLPVFYLTCLYSIPGLRSPWGLQASTIEYRKQTLLTVRVFYVFYFSCLYSILFCLILSYSILLACIRSFLYSIPGLRSPWGLQARNIEYRKQILLTVRVFYVFHLTCLYSIPGVGFRV